MLITAISGLDYPVVMISTLIIAVTLLLSSLSVDVLTAALDPRIRFSKN